MQIRTIALFELRQMMRNRITLLVTLLIPLLLILILGFALSDAFVGKDVRIKSVQMAIFNQDQGALKDGFEQFLQSEEVSQYIIPIRSSSRDEVETRIREGSADFGLLIPAAFSEKVMSGKEAEWEFVYGKKPADNITAQMLLQTFLDRTNFVQSQLITFGTAEGQADPRSVVESSERNHVTIGTLHSDKQYTAMQYYAASMLIMFLLYSAMLAAVWMSHERENHTLQRLNVAPVKPGTLLLGKLSAYGTISIIQSVVLLSATHWLYGVDWGPSFLWPLVICALVGVASISLAVLTAIRFKTTKAITAMFQTIIVAMTALSGGFTPLSGGFVDLLKQFTINHWAADGFYRLMLGGGVTAIAKPLLVLASIAAVLFICTSIVYRRVGYHE